MASTEYPVTLVRAIARFGASCTFDKLSKPPPERRILRAGRQLDLQTISDLIDMQLEVRQRQPDGNVQPASASLTHISYETSEVLCTRSTTYCASARWISDRRVRVHC